MNLGKPDDIGVRSFMYPSLNCETSAIVIGARIALAFHSAFNLPELNVNSLFVFIRQWCILTQNYWVFGLCPSFRILETTNRFGNWICFRPPARWEIHHWISDWGLLSTLILSPIIPIIITGDWSSLLIFGPSHAFYMPCSFHSIRFDHPNDVLWRL
jgi:hypothetical protein